MLGHFYKLRYKGGESYMAVNTGIDILMLKDIKLLKIKKRFEKYSGENNIIVISKEKFDFNKLIYSGLINLDSGLDINNIFLSRLNGKIIRLGIDLDKIAKEINFVNDVIEYKKVEIVVAIKEDILNELLNLKNTRNKIICLKLKINDDDVKISLIKYFRIAESIKEIKVEGEKMGFVEILESKLR